MAPDPRAAHRRNVASEEPRKGMCALLLLRCLYTGRPVVRLLPARLEPSRPSARPPARPPKIISEELKVMTTWSSSGRPDSVTFFYRHRLSSKPSRSVKRKEKKKKSNRTECRGRCFYRGAQMTLAMAVSANAAADEKKIVARVVWGPAERPSPVPTSGSRSAFSSAAAAQNENISIGSIQRRGREKRD